MPSLQAHVKYGDLHAAIEEKMSVPKASQTLLCAGRKWQGIAFGDELKVLEAAGSKGAKEVMGVKVVTLMLMAPAGADGAAEVDRWVALVDEAKSRLASNLPEDSEGLRKELIFIADLLNRASEGLDRVKLVGAQRERRRTVLAEIEAVEGEVAAKKASL